MTVSRRRFIQAAAGGAGTLGLSQASENRAGEDAVKRKQRTLYYNDARHYYLYVFEPPIKLKEARWPIDELVGTTIDTFVYGVERGDGLFYPSKTGMLFGADKRPFTQSPYWRAWENMQSLIARGLDPLQVLIDHAHEKEMDFFASVRMGSYGGMNPQFKIESGGRAMAHQEVRDHQFVIFEELSHQYNVEGVELDFAATPGGMAPYLRPEDAEEYTPVLTDYLRKISAMVRSRPGIPGKVGVRVYPTEAMCLRGGLDVRRWLQEGLVDFLVPMFYVDFTLDCQMPIDWLIEAAQGTDTAVYAMLQPFLSGESTGGDHTKYPSPAAMRAAAANYLTRGVDGLYTWFMKWPLGDAERRMLSELGDTELINGGDKHYILRTPSKEAVEMGYGSQLPVKISEANPDRRYSIPFFVADDVEASSDRVRQVRLLLDVYNLVTADKLTIELNGKSLAKESCLRTYESAVRPFRGQRLEFHLKKVRPRKGDNVLTVSLGGRPAGFAGGVSINRFELFIEYGPYPSTLGV